MLRVVDELLWRLRREGLAIPTSSAIDALRALRAVPMVERDVLVATLGAVLVKRPKDAAILARTVDSYFAGRPTRTLAERLAGRGLSELEITSVLEALAAMKDIEPLLEQGASLDHVLSGAAMERTLARLTGPLQRGFYTHRALERAGVGAAWRSLGALRVALRDALGPRADEVVAALAAELEAAEDVVRERVRTRAEPSRPTGVRPLVDLPLQALDVAQRAEVSRTMRELAFRLQGAARVRKRHARRGRIDPHRTLRRTLRTLGVPMAPAHMRRRKDKPKLVLLCDVSDSVRYVSALLLEVVHAAHELFESTRSFVFVGEVGEVTSQFRRGGEVQPDTVVPVTGNSNYGKAFRTFVERHRDAVDRRTTVVVLGDGRTNYLDPGLDALGRVRANAKALLWLCPDPRERWAEGDSAMTRYVDVCTTVLEVATARDLAHAVRTLTVRR